ncbi:helix-turn-helix domain-containing protein [Polluticaenibacter yanchengensis]|uniref:Helix-turn-helix transcriptional regulator n=1 Tax=Polluticaenibacter yanchengensis TaxID=3014562 RepID=A0ABT4UGD0_9BACT|nr:helix-turn-helix transcriptional regulator [Chitinophagaceae bacterium LY-5]
MLTNKEKFLALVSKEETKTVESANVRLAKKNYTRLSHKIAIAILTQLDVLGWKQITLATKMNVSSQQVNKWVKGNENYTLETLVKLGEIPGISLIEVPAEKSVIQVQV